MPIVSVAQLKPFDKVVSGARLVIGDVSGRSIVTFHHYGDSLGDHIHPRLYELPTSVLDCNLLGRRTPLLESKEWYLPNEESMVINEGI